MNDVVGTYAEQRQTRQQGRPALGGRFAVGIAGLSLAACASVTSSPPVITALSIPEVWSISASAPIHSGPVTPLAAWWKHFDDPLLLALIDDASRANTSVRMAKAALEQSRALAEVQSAHLLPGLRGAASAQRSRRGDAGSSSLFNVGFDASWELDIFGGQHASEFAANAETQVSAANLADVQISVAAEVAINYIQLRGLQARLAIAIANLKSQEETLQITQWRTQAGLLTSLEIEQSRAATEQTRALIPALITAATQVEHRLAVLTWRPPAALHERLSTSPTMSSASSANGTVPTPADNLVLAFPADMLRQRPDVRAAQARVIAALHRVTQAEVARYPSFQLGGSIGVSALTLGSLSKGSSLLTSLLASMAAPIFDGGAARAQVRAQQAALEQVAAGYDAALLQALQEVEDILITLKNNRERLQSLRSAAEAAQNASLLANQRYSSGLIDFQIVLSTQRASLNALDSVEITAADLAADHVRLYKALGGGWEPTQMNSSATNNLSPAQNITP